MLQNTSKFILFKKFSNEIDNVLNPLILVESSPKKKNISSLLPKNGNICKSKKIDKNQQKKDKQNNKLSSGLMKFSNEKKETPNGLRGGFSLSSFWKRT